MAGAGAAVLLVLAWAGVLAWGNSTAGRAFLRDRAGRALRARLGPVEVGDAGLDPLLRATLSPVTILGRGAPSPLLRADRVVVRPRLASLLAGRVEPSVIALRGVRAWPGRDGAELGPFDLLVAMGADGPSAIGIGFPGGGHVNVHLEARHGEVGIDFRAEGRLSLPDDLPPAILHRLPFTPTSGRIRLRASGHAVPAGGSVEADLDLAISDLSVEGERVGPIPLGPLATGLTGRFSWDGSTARLRLDRGRFTMGEQRTAGADVEASVEFKGDRRFALSVDVRAVPWRALVEALPPDLGPPPEAPLLSGALSAEASVRGSLDRRDEWDVEVDLDLTDLRRSAQAVGPTWLSSGFSWKPIDPAPGEPPRRILVGPGNPEFLPYREAPQPLVRAVTASEDAGFFGHRGFDFREIANAVTDRSRVRGASTISQQLAKNLFLSPERTLARKVREALGTIALEASLPKGRLLEIYLNIAEWGPGVYGAGEAARFWFGKDVREVTVREAAFLATVIPSPRRFHARLHRAGVTPWWNSRIDDILRKMRIQNQLTDDQLAAALVEPLTALAARHPEGSPVGDTEAPTARDPEPGEEPVGNDVGSTAPYLSR